jgi:hypothetical protein
MTHGIRKFALTAHVVSSVGVSGAIAAFLALAITGLNGDDVQVIRGAYFAMDLLVRFVIVPLALASLATGLLQSLGTPWGLFRHYWIVAKLVLSALATVILLAKLKLIGYAASMAAEAILPLAELRAVGMELALHAAGGLAVLLIPTALSIYKPRGLTPYGRRKQQEHTPRAEQPSSAPQRGKDAIGLLPGGALTISLRRTHIVGFAVAVLLAHVFILHVTRAGFALH